jgi:16S rRNA (guanine966-N2)-methyltransferase
LNPHGRRSTSAGIASSAPHEVRLIGGQWKRSKLPVAGRPGLRPTPSRVRETLFNWLGQDLSGWRCVDAFAGSGALGFEAASRGAFRVLMVERNPQLARSLEETKRRLGATAIEVRCADGIEILRRLDTGSVDIVFLDPPYGSGLLEAALGAAWHVVTPGGYVYAEDSTALQATKYWTVLRHGQAGAVRYQLLQRVE